MVVRSPGSRPSASACKERRSSLPERVFGNKVTKYTRRGRAMPPSYRSTAAMISCSCAARSAAVAIFDASFTTRKRQRHLPLHRVGDTDHRNFGDVGMRLHGLLDLTGANAMAGDIDHIVGTTEDEGITIGVAHTPVEGRIQQFVGKRAEIGALHGIEWVN